MKTQIALIVCLLAVVISVEAAPKDKRSVLVATPVIAAAPVVASVPVVRSAVVHHNPTTVVKTEQVHSGDQSSYSYSTEVKSAPTLVQTHAAVAAVPAANVVSHTVPATYAYNYGYYPSVAAYSSYYPYAAYSPYHYVVGK